MLTAGRRVLLLGDGDHGEFQDAVAWLAEHTRLTRTATVAEALARLREPPYVLILLQARPGQFAVADVERLHAASPLTRLVALLGSWCEGEGRSGRPWPGVLRIFWHQWQPRLIPELSGTAALPRATTWSLPRTTSVAEQFDQDLRPWPHRQGLIAVHTATAALYRGLSDVCRAAGYDTAWLLPGQPPDPTTVSAVLWDGIACDAAEQEQLRGLRRDCGPVPVIALLDFLRLGDRQRALAAGAAAVLAKPFLVRDLLWHLDQALGVQLPAESLPSVA